MDDDSCESIEVTLHDERWGDAVRDVGPLCRRVASAALADLPLEIRRRIEVGILLADDEMVRGLNRQWRHRDKATNVLSFPGLNPAEIRAEFGAEFGAEVRAETWPGASSSLPGPILLGDVVVAFETTEREAGETGKALSDHLTHLIVHGVLHLCGQDHDCDETALAMESKEQAIMCKLGLNDPYASVADCMAQRRAG